ncbi:GGDEF domain-containing protein [Brevibacillus ginsengisoli]|uniref:GGDEF domain-containing protein n=1 Tax=Brevibacillus ginsengisoli TaxID=363854 RepID=UPI003CED127A
MKYTGRFTLTLICLFTLAAYFSSDFQAVGMFIYLIDITYLLVAWFLGKQYDRAKYYSEHDGLTGVYNRRYLTEMVMKLLNTMKKQDREVSMIVVDVNDFKLINDEYGHLFGDHVLKNVATILSCNLPKGSLVSRWGGDEFLIVIPDVNEEETAASVLQIHEELERLTNLFRINITASIGVSVYPRDASTLDDLIHMADLHMYDSKREYKTVCLQSIETPM